MLSIDFDKFWVYCDNQIATSSRSAKEAFQRRVSNQLKTISCYKEIDAKFAMELYSSYVHGMGKSQFYKIKSFVDKWYEYLCIHGYVSNDVCKSVAEISFEDVDYTSELSVYYFRDLKSVINFIDSVAQSLGSNSRVLNIKAIAILSWVGFDIPSMIKLKKVDVHIEDDGVVHIFRDGHEVGTDVSNELKMIVAEYAATDVHFMIPNDRRQVLLPSEYVFRTARESNASVSVISCTITRFNSCIKILPKRISVAALRMNGRFDRIIQGGIEALNMERNIDPAYLFAVEKKYNQWRGVYCQNVGSIYDSSYRHNDYIN